MAATIRSKLPSRSPTVGLSWARPSRRERIARRLCGVGCVGASARAGGWVVPDDEGTDEVATRVAATWTVARPRLVLSSGPMRVLFLENEDSFSWNVIDRLPCARDEVVIVPGREVAACHDRLAGADVLVIGPGPTDPERTGLVGVVRAAAARRLPTLGICLGHQAIGLAFGARLVRTPPRHGKRSVATFAGARLFAAFDGPQTVMRYHSLALADVAAPLRVVATSEDGVIMAVEHEELPLAGLQFHPDSFATPSGAGMIVSFFQGLA